MNDLVEAYQKYLEDCYKGYEYLPEPNYEPMSLKIFAECGVSDYGIVVYLRFVDLLRSSIIVSKATGWENNWGYSKSDNKKEENSKICNTMTGYGNRLMDDYLAFISDLTGLDIKPNINAYRILSDGIGSITYSYGASGHYEWFFEDLIKKKDLSTEKYYTERLSRTSTNNHGVNRLFLSFDDFRARLDRITAHLIVGHELNYVNVSDEDEEKRIRNLSDEELNEGIVEAENYISEHEYYDPDFPPDLPEHDTYSDIIQSAQLLRDWYNTLDKRDEYEYQLEQYRKELGRRKEIKDAEATSSHQTNQTTESSVLIPRTIPWKKMESRPYCKCMIPSCNENGVREGFCWYHYQEERYLSK